MQLIILATGRCRDAHLRALESEYLNRLPDNTWRVTLRELPDGATPDEEADSQLVAFAGLPQPAIRIVMDERGENLGSRALSEKFSGWQMDGIKAVCLLIGGANGVSPKVREKADWVWSLGKLTFPHQMVRLILAEQMYRVHTLLTGHPYHRD